MDDFDRYKWAKDAGILDTWFWYLRARCHWKRVQRAMIQQLIETPLLDVGCGDGWLLEGEGRRKGIDNGDRNELPFKAVKHDITKPWDRHDDEGVVIAQDEDYQTVTAIAVLEHLEPDGVFNGFREAGRVLKPGGRFIIWMPSKHQVWQTLDHRRPYPPEALTKWLGRDDYGPVPDLELVFRCDWAMPLPDWLGWLHPFKHLACNLGWAKSQNHLLIFEKGQ